MQPTLNDALTAVNTVWVIVAAVLVFLMQAGFLLLEIGFSRQKNVGTVVPKVLEVRPDGKPNVIPGHSMPLVNLGVLILWFGWFGFNPGSTLQAVGGRFAEVVVVTNLAAGAGVLGAMATIYLITPTFDIGMTGNGAIAALVAITAPSGYVEFSAAPIIGVIAGVIVVVEGVAPRVELDPAPRSAVFAPAQRV